MVVRLSLAAEQGAVGFSCSGVCWILVSGSRIEPTSPASECGLLITGPPRKALEKPSFKQTSKQHYILNAPCTRYILTCINKRSICPTHTQNNMFRVCVPHGILVTKKVRKGRACFLD